ncbi:MAG: tetratricopeptide repeat protein [Oceanidesulfovibrio sp.]
MRYTLQRTHSFCRTFLICLCIVCATAGIGRAAAYEDVRAGLEAVRAGDYIRGQELLTTAIESGDLADTNLTIALYNRGNAWFYLEEYDRALDDLTTAIERNPRFLEAFIKRGVTYKELGEYALAIADFNSALELNPNNGRALFIRGLSHALAGDPEQSMRDISAAHRIDQRFVITPLLESLRAAGEEYAIKFMTRAIESGELAPRNLAITHFQRGLAWWRIGADQNAAQDFSRAIELDPDMAAAYLRRADIAMDRGQHREAVQDYTTALAIDSTLAEAYLRRGMAWTRLGNTSQAIRDFASAEELDDTLVIPDIERLTSEDHSADPGESTAVNSSSPAAP